MGIYNLLIVTGGKIDYEWARKWLVKIQKEKGYFDFVIAADSGLDVCDVLKIKVDYLLGDYDSVNAEVLARYRCNVENVAFPREKDFTDTELAINIAKVLITERNHDDSKKAKITVIGATGTRMDHTLANIGLLEQFCCNEIDFYIYDKNNLITILEGPAEISLNRIELYGKYVSVLPVTDEVTGITLEGFKYPLNDAVVKRGSSLGISNEITEDEAKIFIKKGKLLVFCSKD